MPAGVSVVGRSEIETFGSTNMDDVLRSIPGTWTRESPNNPGVAVNIRGFEGSGRVNMMIDGVRQNFRFTGHEAQGFVYVDPNLLAGVDIERGAVSTAGGAGALAGSANFRTLDVGDIIKYGQNAGVLTTATWGSNNVGWSEMFAAGARSGSVGIAGAISKRDSDNYENGSGITVPFTDQDLISGLFKLEFTPIKRAFPEVRRRVLRQRFQRKLVLPERPLRDVHDELCLQSNGQSSRPPQIQCLSQRRGDEVHPRAEPRGDGCRTRHRCGGLGLRRVEHVAVQSRRRQGQSRVRLRIFQG